MNVINESLEELTVEEMAKRWLDLRNVADTAMKEAEILKKEIESHNKEFKMPGVECILTTKGSYDWKKIAMKLNPTDQQIKDFMVVEWNKLAAALAPSKAVLDDLQKKHWSGASIYQLRITK